MRGAWVIVTVGSVLLAPATVFAESGGSRSPFDMDGGRVFDLTLWTIVVFGLLLTVLWRFAWGPILKALQGREKSIADAIAEAQKARDEAAAIRQQLQEQLNQAAAKISAMMDEARRDGEHTKDQLVAQARAEIATEKDRLRREIEMARDQALQDIWNKSVELASALSTTTIRRRLSPEDHRALVGEALASLGEAGADWQRRGGQPA
jgi:F-type H+-transporting ATPase subunit b